MRAIHARVRVRRPALALIGLALLATGPLGCGGGSTPATGPTTSNPQAAQSRRDMADYMKTQKAK